MILSVIPVLALESLEMHAVKKQIYGLTTHCLNHNLRGAREKTGP